MDKKTGKIEAISQKADKFSIKIGNDWFSAFGKCLAHKGDEIEFVFVENGNYKNIKGEIKVIKANTQTLEGNKDRPNVDAGNCLLIAERLFIAGKYDTLAKANQDVVAQFKWGVGEITRPIQESKPNSQGLDEDGEY